MCHINWLEAHISFYALEFWNFYVIYSLETFVGQLKEFFYVSFYSRTIIVAILKNKNIKWI